MVTLYDQFGRPVRPSIRPERRPLAVAPVRDSMRDYVASGLTPRRLAALLREADAGNVGRQAELFEQIEERDGHLLGEKTKRQNVILDLDFQIEPASDDARDQRVAEFVNDFFDHQPDWADTLVAMQDAVGKGYSGLELFWDLSSGQALPEKIEFIEQKRFMFVDRHGVLRRHPLLVSDDHPAGSEIPAWKVMLHCYGGKSGHPARSGVFRVCVWMYLCKNYAIKDWVAFCEVFGMPLRLGKYDPSASVDDRDALITAVSSLGTDAAGIISKATEIEFVETVSGKASGDLYQALARFANTEMSKAILGQTLTAEVGDHGSYAASRTHDGIRLDLLQADGRAIAATVRNQLIRPIVGFNFGWDTALPAYTANHDETEDLKTKSDWIAALLDRGVVMPLSFIRREFHIPQPEQNEETVGGISVKSAKMTGHTDKFTPEQQALERLADDAGAKAATTLETNEENIFAAVQGASSYEEAMERLLALYPAMDPDGLAEIAERAIFAGTMHGMRTADRDHA